MHVFKAAVVGAGTMGGEIAQVIASSGMPVVLKDIDRRFVDTGLDKAREVTQAQLSGLVAREKISQDDADRQLEQTTARITGALDYDGFGDVDFVVEAVPERMQVKQAVFEELDAVTPGHAILSSNTSSLSITEMATDLRRPERVAGMHFFNPVAVLPLVELVRGARTDDATLATVADLADKLRKRPVVVKDAPGFVVNRVLTRMTTVLMDALEHGNTVEETDEAILRLGMPVAPSVLLQMVGPRVANHVLETLHGAWPERFPLSPTLASYAAGSDEIVVVEESPRTVEEITENVLEALADEIRHIVEEGVVAEAADVDTALILGAGWPFFLGGITRHLDVTGVSERVVGRPLADLRPAAPAAAPAPV